jgi:hypothetical protein
VKRSEVDLGSVCREEVRVEKKCASTRSVCRQRVCVDNAVCVDKKTSRDDSQRRFGLPQGNLCSRRPRGHVAGEHPASANNACQCNSPCAELQDAMTAFRGNDACRQRARRRQAAASARNEQPHAARSSPRSSISASARRSTSHSARRATLARQQGSRHSPHSNRSPAIRVAANRESVDAHDAMESLCKKKIDQSKPRVKATNRLPRSA